MTIANLETLAANAQRRGLATGEAEVVPRISDLPALLASSRGKIELEYAGEEHTEDEILTALMKRAVRRVFDERVAADEVKSIVEAFDEGWQVEVSDALASNDYLEGLDEIAGLRPLAERLACRSDAPDLAAAIEFVLEGLHLTNRLNKERVAGASRFGKRREE